MIYTVVLHADESKPDEKASAQATGYGATPQEAFDNAAAMLSISARENEPGPGW